MDVSVYKAQSRTAEGQNTLGGDPVNKKKLVDFHAHILPGVDHGCADIETSLCMIEHAREIGITDIVATPHYYFHCDPIDDFLRRREEGYNLLTSTLASLGIDDIKITLAAEVSLEPDMINELSTRELRALSIAGTDYMLTEMPLFDTGWSNRIYDALCELESRHKIIPIIAHIERYAKNHSESLILQGYIAQVNADLYASGIFGRLQFSNLVKNDAVHLIGSDLHDPTERNYDNFKKLVTKLSPKMLDYFCDNASRILENKRFLYD